MNPLIPGTVLLIEPDDGTRSTLSSELAAAGFEALEARDGMEAFAITDGPAQLDAAVTEMALPVITGVEVVSHLLDRSIPVIVTSRLDGEENRVRALDMGCDDYLVKPYSPREAVARVRAVLRRAAGRTGAVLSFDGLQVDPESREVTVRGELVETTAREFDLLAFLAASPGKVFTRERLLQSVWRSSSAWQQQGTVTEHIHRLREKIEVDPANPKWLVTVRGVGYKFERRHGRAAGERSAVGDGEAVDRRRQHRPEVA